MRLDPHQSRLDDNRVSAVIHFGRKTVEFRALLSIEALIRLC
jgi:hypothetical protein